MFEGVYRRLACESSRPHILCRDGTCVPCVLFMPATNAVSSLCFMGSAENKGRASYHTKLYA